MIQNPTSEPAGRPHDSGDVRETHPAFGRILLNRATSTPGSVLFDSEIRHARVITLAIHEADRTRSLHRDWIHPGKLIAAIDMSEAQWAAMISSFHDGGGTSCTIRATQSDRAVPGLPFAPRLAESTAEVSDAARKIKDRIDAALSAVEEKPTKANVRALRLAVDGAESNVTFAATSLTEHVENVVQKARADIEAMVTTHAERIGLSASDLPVLALGSSENEADLTTAARPNARGESRGA